MPVSQSKIKPHPDCIFVTIFGLCCSWNHTYVSVGRVLLHSMKLWWQQFDCMGWTHPLALFTLLVGTEPSKPATQCPGFWIERFFRFMCQNKLSIRMQPMCCLTALDILVFGFNQTTCFFPLTVQGDWVHEAPCCNSPMRTNIICLWEDAIQCSIFQVSSLSRYVGIHGKVNALHEVHTHHRKYKSSSKTVRWWLNLCDFVSILYQVLCYINRSEISWDSNRGIRHLHFQNFFLAFGQSVTLLNPCKYLFSRLE